MKRLLSGAIACCVLLAISCQKSELTSGKNSAKTAKSPSTNLVLVPTGECDVIDFSGPAHGDVIAEIKSKTYQWPVVVTGYNPKDKPGGENSAMIFNSSAPINDVLSRDLGTPNKVAVPGGYGEGIAGESGTYINQEYWYNILVIKDFNFAYAREEDADGAYTTFDFGGIGAKVTAKAISVIDVEIGEGESAFVKMYASKGGALLNAVALPSTGQNGVTRVDLGNTSGVGYMVVDMNGSMGIDNIEFCKSADIPDGCTYTQGYWKTHGPQPKGNNVNSWPPVQSFTLGNVQYDAAKWQSILNEPVKGNGLLSLAHQLIAARLNIANGANGSSIAATLMAADAAIGDNVIPPVGTDKISTASVSSLVDKLTQFNEGTLPGGPKHCD